MSTGIANPPGQKYVRAKVKLNPRINGCSWGEANTGILSVTLGHVSQGPSGAIRRVYLLPVSLDHQNTLRDLMVQQMTPLVSVLVRSIHIDSPRGRSNLTASTTGPPAPVLCIPWVSDFNQICQTDWDRLGQTGTLVTSIQRITTTDRATTLVTRGHSGVRRMTITLQGIVSISKAPQV